MSYLCGAVEKQVQDMLEKGLQHTSSRVVSAADTARIVGSGDMDVFATPMMVALMENAALMAVASHLPEGTTTVGAHISTSHIKPSALGEAISATATLVEVDGRKLTFNVEAYDTKGKIGEGTHIRYIVDREKFLAKVCPQD